jgi:cytochrome c biogenesis factor
LGNQKSVFVFDFNQFDNRSFIVLRTLQASVVLRRRSNKNKLNLIFDMWKQLRIWILSSWSFLTVGILLGSWWAYHELGWGGWWFWDPVENASLMPWLLATACIHSVTKPKLNYWTLICAQATFIFSILGTFFVRSGLLSSVHSFATDSTRGLYLFFFLLSIILISILNWFSLSNFRLRVLFQINKWRRHVSANSANTATSGIPQGLLARFIKIENFSNSNRTNEVLLLDKDALYKNALNLQLSLKETGAKRFCRSQSTKQRPRYKIQNSIEQLLLLQNFYLCVICIVVFFGTSAPLLFHWLLGRDVGTGAPFYNGTLIPLFTSLFFMLLYVHFLQFRFSNKNSKTQNSKVIKTTIDGLPEQSPTKLENYAVFSQTCKQACFNSFSRDLRVKLDYGHKTTKMNNLLSVATNGFWPSKPGLYLILLSFGHFFIGIFLVELNLLDSIYASICFLLICSILISTIWPKILFLKKSETPFFYRKALLYELYNLSYRTFSRNLANKNTKQTIETQKSKASKREAKACFQGLLASTGACSLSRPEWLSSQVRSGLISYASESGSSTKKKARSASLIVPVDQMINNQERSERSELRTTIYQSKEEMNIAHTGIVFFILGILLSNTLKFEFTEQFHPGGIGIRIGSQICCLRSIDHSFAPTYHSICANLLIFQHKKSADCTAALQHFLFEQQNLPLLKTSEGLLARVACNEGAKAQSHNLIQNRLISANQPYAVKEHARVFATDAPVCMFPEKRFYYSNQGNVATKVAIHSNLFTDFYSLIGTGSAESGWFTTIMKLPFIFCIWLGFFFGVIGGFLSLKKQIQKPKAFWI